ncbi:hypothetical protein FS837_001565 [Tulasnella sp. UAMH 9824]|nr:hypothetical protein FS837_001565 [Tulasnella sp. UAMH 9824]
MEDQLLRNSKEAALAETKTDMPFPSHLENSLIQVPPSHSSGARVGDASTDLMENPEHLPSASSENTLPPEVIALQTERSHRLAKTERSARLFTKSISAMLLAEPTIKKAPNTVCDEIDFTAGMLTENGAQIVDGLSMFARLTTQRRRLLDVKNPFYAFSRTVGRENAAFIGDSKTAAAVYLEANTKIHIDMSQFAAKYDLCRIKHEVLDIQIQEDFVIVARNCSFDVYLLAQIESLLQDQSADNTQSGCHPVQSIVYPNCEESIYRARLIREPNSALGVERGAVVLLSAESSGCYGAVLRRRNDAHSTSLHWEFHVEHLDGIASPASLVFNLAIGLSGRRFATLSDRFLSLYATCPPKATPAQEGKSDFFASWLIPEDLADIPGLLEFDEVTGICVVAMASGRLWVVDAIRFIFGDLSPIPPNFEKGDIDATFIPNPDPARWPVTLPGPSPFGIDHPDKLPRQVVPGCTPWFIHEAAHIPILQPGYGQFNGDTYARTLLLTVDELERSSISHGYKEIIEVKPSPCSGEVHRLWLLQVFEEDWYFCKLRLTETLESVIDYLQRGGRVEDLLEDPYGECWPLDATKVDQYLLWNFRYFSNFGRPRKKFL